MATLALPTSAAIRDWLRTFRPRPTRFSRSELLRGAAGAFIGIVAASIVPKLISIGPAALPFIVAPMGASAVLLFAAPASPLAQPWPVLVGNVSATLVGVASGRLFDDLMVAAAVAVGAAIAVMTVLRCVHPPGGACALFAAVGGPAVREQGFTFALWPVGVNTAILLIIAIAVNNSTGRRYPHVPDPGPKPVLPTTDPVPSERIGLQTGDVELAIKRLDQGLDIMPADVMVLVRDAESYALDRRLGELRCESIMARDVRAIEPNETLYRARLLMNQHHVKALPVIDGVRHVVGIITIYDLFNLDVADLSPASSVMSTPVTTVRADTPVARLVALMTDSGLRHIPVVDLDERLVGIVTRTELIAVLNRALLGSTLDT